MAYLYDDLLEEGGHYLGRSKVAFIGAMARGLMRSAPVQGIGNFASGAFMGGRMAGATGLGRLAHGAGIATAMAPIAKTVMPGTAGAQQGGGPSISGPFGKLAFGIGDAIDAGSYGAFLGSKFVNPETHPRLHTALDAAGLLGLAGTTAHSLATNPGDRKPSVKDLAGLALMGSALYDRTRAHGH